MTPVGRWRTVGIVLAIGSGFDLVFAAAILGFTGIAASMLGLEVPKDPVYLYLNGVLLLVLGGIYGVAAREPERYSSIAPVSAGGRSVGFLFFAWAWAGGRPATFLALGAADLVLAVVTLVAWRRAVRLSD